MFIFNIGILTLKNTFFTKNKAEFGDIGGGALLNMNSTTIKNCAFGAKLKQNQLVVLFVIRILEIVTYKIVNLMIIMHIRKGSVERFVTGVTVR